LLLLALPRQTFRLALCFGIGLLVAACQTAAIIPFRAEDPQALVGEWKGDELLYGNHWAKPFYLTVARVDGNLVFGSVEFWQGYGNAGWHRVRPFRGRLQGHELTFGIYQLTVYDRRMTGSVGLTKAERWAKSYSCWITRRGCTLAWTTNQASPVGAGGKRRHPRGVENTGVGANKSEAQRVAD
jgi:hypothetical protein